MDDGPLGPWLNAFTINTREFHYVFGVGAFEILPMALDGGQWAVTGNEVSSSQFDTNRSEDF